MAAARSPGSYKFYEVDNLDALREFSSALNRYVKILTRYSKVLEDSPVGLGLAGSPLEADVVSRISDTKLKLAIQAWFTSFSILRDWGDITTPAFSLRAPEEVIVIDDDDDLPAPMEAVEEKTPTPSQVKSARGTKRVRAK